MKSWRTFCDWFSTKLPPLQEQPSSALDTKILLEMLMHEDTTYHERINFFLVAQSLLFASVATVWTSAASRFIILIGLFALALTFLLVIPIISIGKRVEWLATSLTNIAPDGPWAVYARGSSMKRKPRWLGTFPILCYYIPAVCIICWFAILVRKLI